MRSALALVLCLAAASSSAEIVYTNGSFNNLSSVSPLNWDPNGIVQDFSVDGAIFNRIRIEVQDSTTPVGQVSSLSAARIRIYDITGRTLSQLSYSETPVFDRTYTTGAGSFRKTLSGFTRGGSDVEYFDFVGDGSVGLVHFAMYLTFPGQTSFPQTFWLSSTPAFPGNAARVFGPGVNSPIGGADDEGAFTIYRDVVPEPATLSALGLGVLAFVRRRRR
jgi:hypothetical protein